ncbi:hypothetical protein VPNG_04269 [Cytospora leucostoma]|uniref:F-box domain-containing protein n=1 Tax=Cytospora leucostoma TaxID=1230097 RepID=A0A423XDS4_9PEZI|nr:hypothetical protein VPNG_04269 [Cytospora leucostoma]
MATSTFDCFSKLPGELREQILTYLLVKPEGVHIDNLSCSDLMDSKRPDPRADPRAWRHAVLPVVARGDLPGWPLSYFLVSQAFHREASAVYFSRNLFYLYSERRYPRVPRVRLGSGAPRLERQDRDPEGGVVQEEHSRYSYLDSLRRIRRLVLSIRSIREEFIPLLQEIVLAGGLKQLHVTVRLSLVWARDWEKLWRTDPGSWTAMGISEAREERSLMGGLRAEE